MSILEDIQSAAIDSHSDLGTILRKCKVLAARLGSQPLENWLLWESNSYPDDVNVPDYRTWPLQLNGHFAGYFGSGIQNAPIPLAVLPEKIRKKYEAYECRQSITGIEAAVNSGEGTLRVSTSDLAVVLGGDVYANYNCIQAWAEFGSGHLVELLNSVRNRILDFVLAISKESPTAGDPGTQPNMAIQASHVTQIFQTTVYGGSATLVGSAHNSSINLNVVQNDFASLERALRRHGLSTEDIQELQEAVGKDAMPAAKDKLGPKVSSWVGRMVVKAAEGTWNVG